MSSEAAQEAAAVSATEGDRLSSGEAATSVGVFELLDRESKQPPAGDAQPKGSHGGGEIIFENVW